MLIASSSNDHVFFEFSAAQPDSSDVLSEIALNARPSQHALVGCACGQNLVCMLNFSWQVLRGSAHGVHLLYVNDFLTESALAIVTSSKNGKAVWRVERDCIRLHTRTYQEQLYVALAEILKLKLLR